MTNQDPPNEIRFRNPVQSLGFAQIQHIITLDPEISDGAYRYYALLFYWAQQNDCCWPRQQTIAELWGRDARTIRRYNQELEDAGYITRQRRMRSSSITWIEDINEIPRLKERATIILGGRAEQVCEEDKTVLTHGTDLSSRTGQKCPQVRRTIEEEPIEEEPLPGQEQAGSSSPFDTPSPNLIERKYRDGAEFNCEWCNEPTSIDEIQDAEGECPYCHSRYKIWKGLSVIVKPSKKSLSRHPLSISRVLERDLSPELAAIQCANDEEAKALREVASEDWLFLKKMLKWAYRLHASGACPKDEIVARAISAFDNNVDDQDGEEVTRYEPGPGQDGTSKEDDEEVVRRMLQFTSRSSAD